MNGNSADGMDTRWINIREQKQAKRILLKRIVLPKIKILSSFTQPHVIKTWMTSYIFFFKWKSMGSNVVLDPFDFHCMEKNCQ